jgi:hypothetical protein
MTRYGGRKRAPRNPDGTRIVREDQHGMITGYSYGCRCPDCHRASVEYAARRPVQDDQHGTPTGYVNGCRCEACTEANTARRRRWRKHQQEE